MKIFGLRSSKEYDGYGIDCAVAIAESKEEAIKLLKEDPGSYVFDDKDVFEIPFIKGYTHIGSYAE